MRLVHREAEEEAAAGKGDGRGSRYYPPRLDGLAGRLRGTSRVAARVYRANPEVGCGWAKRSELRPCAANALPTETASRSDVLGGIPVRAHRCNNATFSQPLPHACTCHGPYPRLRAPNLSRAAAQSRASALQLACAQCCIVVAEAQCMRCIASCAGFGCEHDDPDSPGTRRRPAVVQVQERGQSESHPRRSFSALGRSWGREDSVAPRLVAPTAASGRYPRLVRTGPSEPALGRTRSGLQAATHGAAAAFARDAHGGSGCGAVGHAWAHPCHICTATWLAAATRALSLGSPLPHLHRD